MQTGIEPAPACAGHADRYSLFGENVEKNISRSGMRRTALGSSQGVVNKGVLMCRRWGDWISGKQRALHHMNFGRTGPVAASGMSEGSFFFL